MLSRSRMLSLIRRNNRPASAKSLTLDDPANQYGSDTLSITWTSTGSISNVKLEWYNGSTWATIAASTPNDGSYDWTVPDTADVSGAKLRITDVLTPAIEDESATFDIEWTHGFGGSVWPGLKLAWLAGDSLTPTAGNALTLDRDGAYYQDDGDGTFTRVANNDELGDDHFVFGQTVFNSGIMNDFNSFSTKVGMSVSDSGVESPVANKNWKLIYATSSGSHYMGPSNGLTPGATNTMTMVIVIKKLSARYMCFGVGGFGTRAAVNYDYDTNTVVGENNAVDDFIDFDSYDLSDGRILFLHFSVPGVTQRAAFMYNIEQYTGTPDYTFDASVITDTGFYCAFMQLYNGYVALPLSSPVSESQSNYTVPDSNLSQAITTVSGKHALVGFSGRIRHALSALRETNARGITLADNSDASNKARSIYIDSTGAHYVDVANAITLSLTDAGLITAIEAGHKISYVCNGTRFVACDHDDSDQIYSTGDDTGQTLADADIDILSGGSFVSSDSYSEHFDGDQIQLIYGEYDSVIADADLQAVAVNMGTQY